MKKFLTTGSSSLSLTPLVNSITDRLANHVWSSNQDSNWFERDFKKGPDYRPGLVTVIKFDYLEQQ